MALIGENGRLLENEATSSGPVALSFILNFDGTADNGAAGSLDIGTINLPLGSYITEVYADVQDTLVATDGSSYVTVGISTDDEDAALDSSTGLVTSLNANGITQILTPALTKATAARTIVAAVGGSDITSGTLKVTLITQQ